jgi:hypothetical protein
VRLSAVTLLTLLIAVGTASARTDSRPSLRITRSADALVVRGSGFYGGETVRVTVTAGSARAKVVRASAAGTFTADFGSTYIDPCNALVIRAVGSRGDRALAKLPARQCIPE